MSILLGLLGFGLNLFPLEYSISSEWTKFFTGFIFPMMVSLAWGWKYGLLSAVAGLGCQNGWLIWGYESLVIVPLYVLWIAWHGWAGERFRQTGRFYWSPFVAEIPFRLLSIVLFFNLFPLLARMNPPPWNPHFTASTIAPQLLNLILFERAINALVIIVIADSLLSLNSVRKLLRLDEQKGFKGTGWVMSAALLFGLLFWVIDSYIDYALFHQEDNSFTQVLFFQASGHEVYTRILFIFASLAVGLMTSRFLRVQRKMESRLRNILDSTPTCIIQMDRELKITWANRAAMEKRPGILGKTCYEGMYQQSVPCESCPAHKPGAEKQAEKFIFRQLSPVNGSVEFFNEVVMIPLNDENESDAGFLSIVMDVTEKMKAEEALRQRDEEILALSRFPLENPDPVLRVDRDGRVVFFNEPGRRILELLGSDGVHLPSSWIQPLKSALEGGEVAEVQEWCGDNYFHFTFSPMHGTDRINIYGHDITTEHRAKMELERERDFAEGLIESSNALVVVVDTKGHIVQMNSKMEEVTGYRQEEVQGKSWFEIFVPEGEREQRMVQKARLLAGEGDWEQGAALPLLTKDGRQRQVQWYRKLLKGPDGKILGFTGFGMDVTEQILTKREMELLIEDLESKNTELEQFSYTVSHDLKSPIITIKGFLELLKEDLAEGNQERIEHGIDRINCAADRMQQLLSELLELSRVGRIMNPPVKSSLSSLARQAAEAVSGSLKKIGTNLEISNDLPVLWVDQTRIREVFQNLIENAVKFMGDQPEPEISVGCRQEYGETVIFVRDNGTGIDKRFHNKIFLLFDKLSRDSEGSGVGLALVKRIIQVHGGRIWVESDGPGRGSTFCFTLPGRRDEADEKKDSRCRRASGYSAGGG
jgi:PAS domain S-box-containing protein